MSPEQSLEKIGMRVLPPPPINADERAPPPNGEEAAEPPRFSDVDLALRFVAEWGKWLSWDGKCWRFDTLAAFDLARDLCQGEAAK